jgi:hypothetical protein
MNDRESFIDRWASRPTGQLVLVLGTVLFVLAAFPLVLTPIPPMQDLPNHLASIHAVEHPELYPELVFNGHFKTNGALFLWLHVAGRVVGLFVAAKLFAALACAAAAYVIPWALVSLTGDKRKAILGSFFAWPLVHNWFVSMGMLDYALGVAASLALLTLAKQNLEKRTAKTFALLVLVGLFGWYAHVFALLVAFLLMAIELVRRGRRGFVEGLVALVPPLLPAAGLVVYSVLAHLLEPKGTMAGNVDIFRALPVWELLYNAWAEWMWAFTRLEAPTLVPTVALVVFAVRGLRAVSGDAPKEEDVPFFSKWAVGVLLVAYALVPYAATNWFHVNSRFLAYLWFGALLRVPTRLPRGLVVLAAVSAVLETAAMSVDYVRLERDRREFTAGIASVPRGARLLPLLFRSKSTSENSRNLLHAWGFYVVEKDTSAPLLFAHSRSFPVMYREPPPDRWNHLVLEGFAPGMQSAAGMCGFLHQNNLRPDDCETEYRERWSEFWKDATPRFDHVLLWEATPEARANVPAAYVPVFEQGKLVVLERRDPPPAAPATSPTPAPERR